MTYIEKIAYHLDQRDEVPNQELAAFLAAEKSWEGVAEIASYLDDKNTSIQSDCIKVLYEIGYISPLLITEYAETFIRLLDSKNNRMVWGAMIALSTIAEFVPEKIWPYKSKILNLIETGTVITNVAGVKTYINLAKAGDPYYAGLIEELMHMQKDCRSVDFAKRAEDMWGVIRPEHVEKYKKILEERLSGLSNAAQKRLTRVIKNIKSSEGAARRGTGPVQWDERRLLGEIITSIN